MRPAQLRRFAQADFDGQKSKIDASMRPAQLRRFAWRSGSLALRFPFRFNEAGAAAPVCRSCGSRRADRPDRGFNEAGAAAPVCPGVGGAHEIFDRLLQ